jgi:exodeoxyribonuclease V beta subunit
LLSEGSPDEVAGRRDHLARAVSNFDAATIATTHGFCQEVLSGLGVAADLDRNTTFVDDLSDLVTEVVDDLYVRRFHARDRPPFSRREAMEVARIAIANPGAPIEPSSAPAQSPAAMRARLAKAVRRELAVRKHRTSTMSFDDLLTRLRDALRDAGGPEASARLRERYRVVLIDEFQDTDPIQWEIVHRAFGTGDVTLVLVADPKQAIYAFRGADVYAYLEAAKAASTRETLRVNWRSDQDLIDAYDALFDEAQLGDEGILYRRVRAAPANRQSRLSKAPVAAPLRIRVVQRTDPTIDLTDKGFAGKPSALRHVAKDLAGDLVKLLSSAAQIEIPSNDESQERRERVRPGHVAVLVRTHQTAALVREELETVGVPAVINGAGSVFATPAAREWLRLLEAIERPTSSLRAHSAALTSFLGRSAAEVAAADDDDWEEIHRRLHRWANVLRSRGVASLVETIFLEEGLPARVLSELEGERHLTDLRHIGQLLHRAAAGEQLGAAALTTWLGRRIDEAEGDTADEERSRRLDSDAQAVQILTIHRSKGLEFPIVYCPYLWDPQWIPKGVPVFFHDPDADNTRTIDVGLEGASFASHQGQHLIEQRGEELRLAYVALTRARHQAIVWWAGSWGSKDSALARLLFERSADGTVAAFGRSTPSDADATARFEALAASAPGAITVERSYVGSSGRWMGEESVAGSLSAASFDRGLDWIWRRTSYTDLTAGTYEARVGSEPEESVVTDEPPDVAASATVEEDTDGDLTAPSLFGAVSVGLQLGTLVHEVLQSADFAAPNLEEELRVQVARERARRDAEFGDPETLVSGLRAAIETPLGDVSGNLRLRDLEHDDRLDELQFELPLAGGDNPTGSLTLAAIGDVLQRSGDDRLRSYAERLHDPSLRQSVRGFLTGSIDLAARIGSEEDPRFVVVDYKTNWLAGPDDQLIAWHYRPDALATEMARHHYLLQSLLYGVALHRYLRWRLPGYEPDRHFAGVLYLFLRGMSGPDTPMVNGDRCGVFAWRPSAILLNELSDALDGVTVG